MKLLRLLVLIGLAGSLHAQTILVQPYVQPGDGAALGGADTKVIAWMTDPTPGKFTVEFGATKSFGRKAKADRVHLNLSTNQQYFKYAATLANLPFNREIFYRVRLRRQTVRQGSFLTRKTPDQSISFIVTGDTASGEPEQRKVAYQMARAKPEFLLICGDIVYSKGLVSEYLSRFWPVYDNVAQPDPTNGAPIMQSVPIYPVLGNHDVGATNLTAHPDGFGVFYFFHPPLNGPKSSPWFTPLGGTTEQVRAFKAAAGASYPAICTYSFDNGPAHFLVLDSNRYVLVADPEYQRWIRDDLEKSNARWKIVCFHHPGFNSSARHNSEQKMRLLAPLFEECGVDVVFAGHVHNYQRSKPLRFTPDDPTRMNPKGLITGQYTLDQKFDGVTFTKPDGILYLVTGGGGAKLYDSEFTGKPETWKNDLGLAVPFTEKFIADRHSFTQVTLSAHQLLLRQVDEDGAEVDRITVTK